MAKQICQIAERFPSLRVLKLFNICSQVQDHHIIRLVMRHSNIEEVFLSQSPRAIRSQSYDISADIFNPNNQDPVQSKLHTLWLDSCSVTDSLMHYFYILDINY